MSQPSWHRQLALAMALFILGGFSYWLVFKHKPDSEDIEEKNKKILAFDKNQVESVQIVNGTNAVTLKCSDLAGKNCKSGDNAKWEVTEPIQVKADDANTNSLVSTLNGITVSDTISMKEETPDRKNALLKDYGLDPDSILKDRRIQINASNQTTILYLGQTHPIGEGIFAAVEHLAPGAKSSGKIDDTQVYVLPSYVKSNFDHDLTYWRDKKILPIAAHEVDSFVLKNTKGTIQGQRDKGMWDLRSGSDEVAGDTENMDTLLTGATYLVAKNFISDDKTDAKSRTTLKGAKNVITLTLRKDKTPEPIVLALFQKPNGKPPAKGVVQYSVYATVSTLSPLFELEGYAKERLDKELKDLRLAKLITSMDRFSAKRMELKGSGIGNIPWVLLNKDSKWSVEGDPKEQIDSEKVQNFLDRLASSKILEFITKNPPDISGGLEMTIGDDALAQKRKLLFWRVVEKTGPKLYAKDLLSARKEVFLMDNTLTDAVPWEKARLKK